MTTFAEAYEAEKTALLAQLDALNVQLELTEDPRSKKSVHGWIIRVLERLEVVAADLLNRG